MFASHAGNLILTTQGHCANDAAPTSVISMAPQVSHNGTSLKALTAQFFSPSAAVVAANTNSSSASVLTSGVVSLFDAPAYVTSAAPTRISTANSATFFIGGYSVYESNDHIYEASAEDDHHKSDEDDDEANNGNKKHAKSIGSLNQHLAAAVVKGHRTAVLSPCHGFIYILRTDTFALDWAVDISAIVTPEAAVTTIQQITLLDAHRVLLLLPKGQLYFATRPLSSSNVTTFHSNNEDDDTANTYSNITNAGAGRSKPPADKFRYFVTSKVQLVAISGGAKASIVSMLPLKATHSEKNKTLLVSLLVVAGANTSYSATTASLSIPLDEDTKDKPSLSVTASSAASASFTTPAAPTSFSIVPPTVLEASPATTSTKGGKQKSNKNKAAASGAERMTALITPVSLVIPTNTTTKNATVAYLVAIDSATVVSATPVTATPANNTSFVSVTAAELLSDNMLAVGLVAGSGDVPASVAGSPASSPLRKSGGPSSSSSASSSPKNVAGKIVYGTFYFESDEDRSKGAIVETSLINLTEEDANEKATTSSFAATSSATLSPVGFYYNSRLSQHAVVATNTITTTAASSSSSTKQSSSSSSSAIHVRLCGISLVSGFPANGATIAPSSWVPVHSVLSSADAGGGANLSGASEDRFTSGTKNAGADSKHFVTLNYPIVTLAEASAAASGDARKADPYRIRDARIFGRASITAPVSVHARTLSQWPNAVIGVLKLLVDYTSYAAVVAYNNKNSSNSTGAAGAVSTGMSASVMNVFKSIADATKAFVSGGKAGAATAGAAFEVTIVTHAFHPSAIRNALRRLPFAVAAAAAGLSTTNASTATATTVTSPKTKKPSATAAAANAKVGANTSSALSTTALVNGLFSALLDGVDATSSSLLVSSSSSASPSSAKKNVTAAAAPEMVAADSFLRSAVGALEICHHIITLQGQLGVSLQPQLTSRYVLLLRALRSLGDECDQIAGRLGATLDRQRITSAHAIALTDEKARILEYQQELKKGGHSASKKEDGEEESATAAATKAAVTALQPKVSFSRVDIRHKIAAVGTGNVADCLSAQLHAHKNVLDLVDAKLSAKLAAKAKAVPSSTATNSSATPLYASAGMRQLKSDFQDNYERYLLLGSR